MDYTGATKVKHDPRWNWRSPTLPPLPPDLVAEFEALAQERLEALAATPEPAPDPIPAAPAPKPRKRAKKTEEKPNDEQDSD